MSELAATLPHPFLDALLRVQRKSHLVTELTAAGMPDAAKAVGALDWQTILTWIETNAPVFLGIITALIALLGGG